MSKLASLIEKPIVSRAVDVLLVLNAIILAILTFPELREGSIGNFLEQLDKYILAIFVVELLIRITAYGKRFFKDGWNIFDFVVILASCLAYNTAFSVLRTFRVLRLMRLISNQSILRHLIDACIRCVSDILAVMLMAMLLVFIYAVMANGFFGELLPERFGNIFISAYSLMKVSLFSDWDNVAAAAGANSFFLVFVFFFSYFALTTFVLLNMMIAVVYDAYAVIKELNRKPDTDEGSDDFRLAALEAKVDRLLELSQKNYQNGQ
jgi:voltage-gated sodium channel